MPAVLIGCMCVSILATDLYTPSLPSLPEALNTTPSMAQATMTASFVGYALGPFLVGPLSDRYGRKPALALGMALFTVFSAACALAPGIWSLIAARCAQGAAASVMSVLGVVIIRDLFEGERALKVMSLYGGAIGVAPAAGPLIGGWIDVTLGWRAGFWLLAILGALAAWASWAVVPETGVRTRLDFGLAWRRYGKLVSDRQFALVGIAVAATFGGLFAWVTEGPFVFIEKMGVKTEAYGWYYAGGVAAYVTGALVANRLADHVSARALTKAGVSVTLVGALVLLSFVAIGFVTPLSVMVGMAVFSLGLGLTFASAPLVMLARVPQRLGAAAGVLFGAGQSAGAALGAGSVAAMHDGTAWPMAISLTAFATIAAVLVLSTRFMGRAEAAAEGDAKG